MSIQSGTLGRIGRIGRPSEPHPSHLQADEAAQRRVEAARLCNAWQEVDPAALIPRGKRFLVHSETDEVFVPHTGAIWNHAGRIEFGDQAPLYFVVQGDGDVLVLEKYGESWSAIVARQTHAEHRAKAHR